MMCASTNQREVPGFLRGNGKVAAGWKGLFVAAALAVWGAVPAVAVEAEPFNEEVDGQPDVEIWLSEGVGRYGDKEFRISGGSPEFPSPTGAFTIQWRSRKWWSKQWDAPMPYAMFFHNGAALHVGSLNSRSHGCIRVSEDTAAYLFRNTRDGKTRVFVYP